MARYGNLMFAVNAYMAGRGEKKGCLLFISPLGCQMDFTWRPAVLIITARTRLAVQVTVSALSGLVKQRRAAHPYYFILLLKVLFDGGQTFPVTTVTAAQLTSKWIFSIPLNGF